MNPTLSAYLLVLQRRWRTVVSVPLVTLILAAAYLILTPPAFESSALLFVSTPRDDETSLYRGDMYAKERMDSYAALIASPDLAARVNDDNALGLDPQALSAAVSLTPIPGTVLLQLSASGDTPNDAQTITAAYVDGLRRSVAAIETVPGSPIPRAELITVQPPSFSTTPGGLPAWMVLGGAGGAGLVFACFLVVLIALLDGRIRRPEDAAEATGAPVLAAFPASIPWRELQAHPWVSETARELRTSLDRLSILGSRTIMLASAEDGAGKTGTALAVARAVADRGWSVAVVDFDSRASNLSDALELTDGVTVRQLLGDRRQTAPAGPALADTSRSTVATWHGVAIIPFGAAEDNPGSAADSPAIGGLFDALRANYDWLVVDTPGVEGASDATRLVAYTDAVLLLASTGRTSFDALRRTGAELAAAGGTIAGVVLTGDARRPRRTSRGEPSSSDTQDSR